jgi:hypothetical protein
MRTALGTPSPGTPGEGWGEGDLERRAPLVLEISLTPSRSRSSGRGGNLAASHLKTGFAGCLRCFLLLLMGLAYGCTNGAVHAIPGAPDDMRPAAAATEGDADAPETEAAAWKTIASVLGRQGTLHQSVYTIVIPRDDLYVTVEEMYVPTAAGIESRFNFYHCSCGKTSVVGEFVLADYEADDVVSTLLEKQFTVASLAPFLLHEHPRLLSVHFKGEGKSAEIAAVLKEALSYTGREREATSTNVSPIK